MATKQSKQELAQAPAEEAVVAGIAAPHIRRTGDGFSTQQILPPSGAPSAQMVKVKEIATGRVFGAWAIDAREMINGGGHVYAESEEALTARPGDANFAGAGSLSTSPEAGSPIAIDPVPAAPPAPTVAANAESLEDMSKADLQALAKRSGVSDTGSKAELVAALQSHVDAGTITLKQPAPLDGSRR